MRTRRRRAVPKRGFRIISSRATGSREAVDATPRMWRDREPKRRERGDASVPLVEREIHRCDRTLLRIARQPPVAGRIHEGLDGPVPRLDADHPHVAVLTVFVDRIVALLAR